LLLDKPILLIGRHEECDIQLNSRKVSRKHCVIALVGESLVVRDLGSTNGIRVNGTRVADGSLRTGDELTIGNFRYQVHVEQRRDVLPAPVAPARPAVPVAKQLPAVTEDDLLESADEPVPLPEPGGRPPAARQPPDLPPRAGMSYALPEDVGLKPESSAHLPPPAAG
ncbi:MAG TPA: FHA domain-containing protein, partial [Gemmataceae bacterium]